ncbi:MAG: hypothetical protein JO276_15520 [Sphingomonadaceae bacterium]|nr:hypothetical protein [Sphingomonadaceae bacterium]
MPSHFVAALLAAITLFQTQSGAVEGGQGAAPPPVSGAREPAQAGGPQLIRRPVLGSSVSLGPSVSDGEAVFDTPQPVAAPPIPESLPLVQDAILASETLRLLPIHFRLAEPVVIPELKLDQPAGSDVGRLVKDGAIRHCIRHHETYQPVHGENGEIYPGLCFEDRDNDGRFETAILLPYHPQEFQPIVKTIAPVRLGPNPADADHDPRALRLTRRLRVAHVDGREALIIAEQGIATSRETEVTGFTGRPQESLILPLREGASGSLGGIALQLRRDGAGWRIFATGRLAPWLEVRENGNLIIAGGLETRRRPAP